MALLRISSPLNRSNFLLKYSRMVATKQTPSQENKDGSGSSASQIVEKMQKIEDRYEECERKLKIDQMKAFMREKRYKNISMESVKISSAVAYNQTKIFMQKVRASPQYHHAKDCMICGMILSFKGMKTLFCRIYQSDILKNARISFKNWKDTGLKKVSDKKQEKN